MATLDFATRSRLVPVEADDPTSIRISITCPHSRAHRTARCCAGESVARVPLPRGTPVDQWDSEHLRQFIAAVVYAADSGYRPSEPMPLRFEQLGFKQSTSGYLGGRRVKRNIGLTIGGHRVTFDLNGFPHRAFAAFLAQHSDRDISITMDVERGRLDDEEDDDDE
jgi:hypothetical protein